MNITRRDALKALAGTAALAALPRGRSSQAEPLPPAPASPTGSFHHSACRWCYKDIALEDLAREGKRIGLESVELLDPVDWPVVQRHGLTCAMANGVTRIPEGLNRLEHHAVMVPGMIERIKACADAGLPNVICFSGNRGGMDDELGLANCAVALKQIVGEAERRRVTVCMELLNSKVNHKDYMCDHTVWGVELVKRVGSRAVQAALRHLPHADHGGRRRQHDQGQPPVHRPLPHGRRPRAPRDRRDAGAQLSPRSRARSRRRATGASSPRSSYRCATRSHRSPRRWPLHGLSVGTGRHPARTGRARRAAGRGKSLVPARPPP